MDLSHVSRSRDRALRKASSWNPKGFFGGSDVTCGGGGAGGGAAVAAVAAAAERGQQRRLYLANMKAKREGIRSDAKLAGEKLAGDAGNGGYQSGGDTGRRRGAGC